MMSKKLTLSLTSFVALIAFGLVCFAPSVFADGRDDDNKGRIFDLGVTISAAEEMVDVDARGTADDIQIATGRDRVSRDLAIGDLVAITLLVEFSAVVNLAEPGGSLEDIEDATANRDDLDTTKDSAVVGSGGNFGADDVYVAAYDKEGRALGVLPLSEIIAAAGDTQTIADYITSFRDDDLPSRQFLVRIDENHIVNAYTETARRGNFEIYSFVFFIPQGKGNEPDPKDDKAFADAKVTRGISKATLDHAITHFGPGAHHHLNKASNQFRVDLVDDDEGEARYATTLAATPLSDEGVPGVVTIDQLRERAGFIESGPFDVRIILTEEPKGGLTTDLIMVEGGGSATAVTKGATLKGAHTFTPTQDSELTLVMASYTTMAGIAATDDTLPEATGRDNKYHQYFVTITPDPGIDDGDLTISVKQFADNVLPVGKEYVPLTPEQRRAVTLTSETVRDARTANEALDVRVGTAADTTSTAAVAKKASMDAYETRTNDDKDGVLNQNPNLKSLDKGLVIPANGYLVLVKGKADNSGVIDPKSKIAEKLTVVQQLYNVKYEFGLLFPADDLSNFFNQGGSLSIVYADIPAATGSRTDESKASTEKDDKVDKTHADYTGYDGASTNAYAAGAVMISEVMWGQYDGETNAQYIELHNTTAADIGIDHLEWAIAIGSVPAPFAALDAVNNNPSTGWWQVPGSDGVSLAKASELNISASPAVSMSRVTGGTDGSAAASWAASGTNDGTGRQSSNLARGYIGTPGAANIYMMPAPAVTTPVDPVTPAAAVATAADIMITEIMVASNDGRLPQWIEIANDSAAAVSLSGWSLEIENDSADADVVGESIELDLGDVEIGADQVALVVSKSGRNSGVGTGEGDLRADRIIDVQSAVSPTNARYSLISEMGFMISLIPPQTGAVRTPGDVAGNLGGGWELPMSEGGRSSLIRSDKDADAGTDAADWMLASDTMLNGAYRATYYGSDEDVGTPGYDAGGALPVELSGFNAARDKVTGAVVITWSTQSELNNAGFFIKRSQQKKGKFVVVNPTMIAGAGTTAEKQSYTYTDATADPNVIYFYQIEDVSLDGNRQTLTRAHRLKGHIGAAGKATTTWGELKSSRE